MNPRRGWRLFRTIELMYDQTHLHGCKHLLWIHLKLYIARNRNQVQVEFVCSNKFNVRSWGNIMRTLEKLESDRCCTPLYTRGLSGHLYKFLIEGHPVRCRKCSYYLECAGKKIPWIMRYYGPANTAFLTDINSRRATCGSSASLACDFAVVGFVNIEEKEKIIKCPWHHNHMIHIAQPLTATGAAPT